MIIRDITRCPYKRVIDHSVLCELLHPSKVAAAEAVGCSIAHAIVPVGESTLPHALRRSTELYYILEGTGEMHIGDEAEPVLPGQMVLIPPEKSQYIVNTGIKPLVILCIVSPPWQADDEYLL
ncbi:MAG: cupin domain-containing protein [Methanoregula sp.]|jgi:mannose-6-phosphate isomerase-like protein (cupin superfamily)